MLSFVVGAGIALFVLWAVSLQRRLVVLDENIHQAMNQIGVQLASLRELLTHEGELAPGLHDLPREADDAVAAAALAALSLS